MEGLKMCRHGIGLLLLAGLLCVSGCVTYNVSPAKNLSKTEAVAKVNGLLDWVGQWDMPDNTPLGAYETGFSVIHLDSSESHYTYGTYGYGSAVFSYSAWGSSRTYSYGDIEEIKVKMDLFGLVCLGIMDPTYTSCVILNMRDGNSYELRADDRKKQFSVFFPFYLFDFRAGDVREAGEAFEYLRVSAGIQDEQ